MGRYFLLQLKRAWKIMPFVLAVTLALFVGIVAIVGGISDVMRNKEENRPITVGLVGDTDNEYMQYATTAIASLENISVSFDLVVLEEEEAKRQIFSGDLSAYVLIPDDFIESVSRGENIPLKFITSPGADGVIPMFKEEISRAIIDIFVYSEKGVFGLEELLWDTDADADIYEEINALNFEYVGLILDRTDVFTVEELGASRGMSFIQYLICGLTVFFFFLIGIPFATLYIKNDYSMSRVLRAKNYGYFGQLSAEYGAHFISLLLNVCVIIGAVLAATAVMKKNLLPFELTELYWLFAKVLPIVVMICAFNMLIFEISDNLVSGILMHFFITLSMCYVSGCFYPTYTFPKAISEISAYLPTGAARDYFANVMREEATGVGALILVAYAVVFFVATVLLRRYKTARRGTL